MGLCGRTTIQGQAYDAVLKSYRCYADNTLVDGVKMGLMWTGPQCTGSAPPPAARRPPPLTVLLASAAAVAIMLRV